MGCYTKKGCFQMEITKHTTMGEMLDYDRGIAYVLMQSGMHCVGCPVLHPRVP